MTVGQPPKLRVLCGALRGRSILPPPAVHGNTHLTLSLVKEALFQVLEQRLGEDLHQTAFYDLCAGSGQMAIEALSVGFSPVHLCEVDAPRLRHLAQIMREGDYSIQIHRRDFRRMAPMIAAERQAVAFLDPPYSFWDREGRSDAVDRLLHNLLNVEAPLCRWIWLIIHAPGEYYVPPEESGRSLRIDFAEQRPYRRQRLSLLRLRASAGPTDA